MSERTILTFGFGIVATLMVLVAFGNVHFLRADHIAIICR